MSVPDFQAMLYCLLAFGVSCGILALVVSAVNAARQELGEDEDD